ncbi:MAG: hypothetical protein EBS17_08355 [Flavobacteriia bacterium]|nr:hypothetical protein [Flavobacteriia bacterium]
MDKNQKLKMGRPKKPQTLSKQIMLRLTPKQYETLKELSEVSGSEETITEAIKFMIFVGSSVLKTEECQRLIHLGMIEHAILTQQYTYAEVKKGKENLSYVLSQLSASFEPVPKW